MIPGAHEQMIIRACDIDPAGLDRFAILGVAGRQRPGPPQDFRQQAAGGGRDMLHQQNRRRQVVRQAAAQPGQRVHPSGGSTQQDDVVIYFASVARTSRPRCAMMERLRPAYVPTPGRTITSAGC